MSALHGWFRPRVQFDLAGRRWIASNHVAIESAEHPGLQPKSEATLALGSSAESSRCSPTVTEADRSGGYLSLGTATFAAHLIDLCAAAHPGLAWRQSGGDLDAVIGWLDGRPVAIAMPTRGRDPEGTRPGCHACEGTGKAGACPACGGAGEARCHACEHMSDCLKCSGNGRVGKCATCGGSGAWLPEHDRASPWTDAHRREARRRTFELAAISVEPDAATWRLARVSEADEYSEDEAGFRAWLEDVGAPGAEREVRRVRALAEGRLVRETVWSVRAGNAAGVWRALDRARDWLRADAPRDARIIRITRIRRAAT